MAGFRTILVPIDFSPFSEAAVHYASSFSRNSKGTIHLVHVVDDRYLRTTAGVYANYADLESILREIEEHAKKSMASAARKAAALGISTQQHVVTGLPAHEIVKLAREVAADLIVTATHGHSGFDRLVLGSTYEKILRESTVPVLAVKQTASESVGKTGAVISIKRILCPCDFSDFSHQAVPIAAELCKDFGASLILAHAVDTWMDYPDFLPSVALSNSPNLQAAAEKSLAELAAKLSGSEVKTLVLSGVPHRELRRAIENEHVDLVVMATHGRGGLSHALLGSVTEKLVRTVSCPVLTIRPAA